MRTILALFSTMCLMGGGCRYSVCHLGAEQQRNLLKAGVQSIRQEIQKSIADGTVNSPVVLRRGCCKLYTQATKPSARDLNQEFWDAAYVVEVSWEDPKVHWTTLKQIIYDQCGNELKRTGV